MQSHRLSMHDAIPPSQPLTPASSKPIFLDYHSDPGALSSSKFFSRRHPASPNHLTSAFEHGPLRALAAGDPPGQKHLLEFPGLAVAAGPIRVARLPVPQNQGNPERCRIESFAVSFSVALR